jgi:hypothetical protein
LSAQAGLANQALRACPASSATASNAFTATAASGDIASKWGIEVTALRLSANGSMVDFRYRVLDPKKASQLSNPKIKPLLIDQASGAQLKVPSMPKVGQLRGTAEHLIAGKIYIMLFANVHKTVKSGQKVTLVVGESRAENLTVDE